RRSARGGAAESTGGEVLPPKGGSHEIRTRPGGSHEIIYQPCGFRLQAEGNSRRLAHTPRAARTAARMALGAARGGGAEPVAEGGGGRTVRAGARRDVRAVARRFRPRAASQTAARDLRAPREALPRGTRRGSPGQ